MATVCWAGAAIRAARLIGSGMIVLCVEGFSSTANHSISSKPRFFRAVASTVFIASYSRSDLTSQGP